MSELSDFDLNIVVRGSGFFKTGTKNFARAHADFTVKFNDKLSKAIPGGEFIQKLIDFSPMDSELRSTAKRGDTKHFTDPFEIYMQDRREFMQFTSRQSFLNARIFKGAIGMVMMPGNRVSTVVSPSVLFDSGAASHSTNSILLGSLPFITHEQTVGAALHAANLHGNLREAASISIDDARRLLDAVRSSWQMSLGKTLPSPNLTIRIFVDDLPGNQLAEAAWTRFDEDGSPIEAQIEIDPNAAGWGWFVDSSPWDASEFDANRRATDDRAVGRYDAFSVLAHEFGHLLGFTQQSQGFEDLTEWDHVGRRTIQVEGRSYQLDSTGNELNPFVHPDALMAASIGVGMRKTPTPTDVDILRAVLRSSMIASTPESILGNVNGQVPGKFVPLAEFVASDLSAPLHRGIENAQFTIADVQSEQFGWHILGDGQVANEKLTLRESIGMFSDLSQSFVIPAGTRSLAFSLSGMQLSVDPTGSLPPDAFEVALLRADQTTSLVGAISGLNGSDSLLNLQPDGTITFAPQVLIEGVSIGQKLDLSQPLDVVIEFGDLPADQAATLYFDLIGFGEDDSQVSISNIELQGALAVSWHNSAKPLDVNNDGLITPLDALQIINELNARRLTNNAEFTLPTITDDVAPPPFYDVSNDGRATPFDALLVINHLNRVSGGSSGNNGNNGGTGGEGDLPSSWHNTSRPMDVTNNQEITALDALQIINELNQPRISDPVTKALPTITQSMKPAPYLDVSNDQLLTRSTPC